MKLSELISRLQYWPENHAIKFVGIKWQDERHPSAEEFPIDFVSCSEDGMKTIKVKFVTKPKHP